MNKIEAPIIYKQSTSHIYICMVICTLQKVFKYYKAQSSVDSIRRKKVFYENETMQSKTYLSSSTCKKRRINTLNMLF